MSVKPISEFHETQEVFAQLMQKMGISNQLIQEVLIPRVRILNNELFLSIQFEDIDGSQVSDRLKFARMRSVASKYLIPIPESVEPIPITTVIVTSEGTRLVESESVAKSEGFLVLNNPSNEAIAELNHVWAETNGLEPRDRILAMISAAKNNGCENIFPANRNFENAIETGKLPIEEPGLFRVKPTLSRAVCRFPGPTIIDQTESWGAKDDGSRNYQIQPNTVFIIHLDEEEKIVIDNNKIKANSYELKPFLEDYRTVDDKQLNFSSVNQYIPIVHFKGDLSVFSVKEIEAIADTLLKYNREIKTQ
jgi:hypothetical protein